MTDDENKINKSEGVDLEDFATTLETLYPEENTYVYEAREKAYSGAQRRIEQQKDIDKKRDELRRTRNTRLNAD